jgi:hypothetical protein
MSFDVPRNPDGSVRTRADEEAEGGLTGMLYRAGHGVSDGMDWVGDLFSGSSGNQEEEEEEAPARSWSPPRNPDGSIRTRKDEEAEGGVTGMLYRAGHTVSDGLDSLFGGLF